MNIENTLYNFETNQKVKVFGRVKRLRILSKKLAFFNLEEAGCHIQIGVRNNNLPKSFDIVECEGITGFSETNEETVWCDNVKILSSNNGELSNFKGIKDGKLKTEKRFLDILTNPNLKENLLFRSKVIRGIRDYLHNNYYVEIETPILSNVPSGATAEPFKTRYNALNDDYYLRIATEIPLKKAIVAGFERVFEIGKIFRNEGIDKTHNPEFTSIELYQSFAKLCDMENILLDLLKIFGYSHNNIERFEYIELVKKYGVGFDKYLINPTFVYGQPLEDTPLCASRNDGRADRFEFYINGFEVANAYQELTDYKEQEKRLNGSNDDGLIEALKYGCPPLAGMGIGIERLIMALKNESNISNVIFFPTKRNSN